MSGPIIQSRCTVCRSPRVGAIDALVRAGTRTLKDIAADTGVPYGALRRHAVNHVAPSSSSSSSSAPTLAPLGAGASAYETLRRRVDVLNAMDETTMSNRDRIAHSEELRRAAESLAKLEPVDMSSAVVSVADVVGLGDFMGALLVLRDRPRVGREGDANHRAAAVGGWSAALDAVIAALTDAVAKGQAPAEEEA